MEGKQMVKKKENKGITLMALVITIVIMLVLSGIAIGTLTGNNGLITPYFDTL